VETHRICSLQSIAAGKEKDENVGTDEQKRRVWGFREKLVCL